MNPSQCITDDNKWKWDKWKCPKASEPHSNSTRHLTREPGSVCMAMTGNFEEVMLVPGSQGWSDMALLVVQLVKNVPAMQETWVRFLGWEDPLEKEMATHSSILAWKAQGQRSLQSTGLQEWLNHHHQAKSEQRARQWSAAHCGLYMSGLETESSRWGVGRSVSILVHSALLPACSIPSFLPLAKAEECINPWKGTNALEALGRTLPTL